MSAEQHGGHGGDSYEPFTTPKNVEDAGQIAAEALGVLFFGWLHAILPPSEESHPAGGGDHH